MVYFMRIFLTLLPGLVLVMGLMTSAAQAAEDPDGHAPAADEEYGEVDHSHAGGGDHHNDAEHAYGDHAHDSHAGHHGPASNHPLSIDPDLAIVTLIVFVVLFFVLKKFAWGPILAGLAVREKGVADDLEAAAARRKDAEKLLADYQLQLERAGEEVRQMLDGAKKEAEIRKLAILEEASKAAAAHKQQATSEIEAAKTAAISEIGHQSVQIAFRVASGALHRDVNPADHQDLVSQAGL